MANKQQYLAQYSPQAEQPEMFGWQPEPVDEDELPFITRRQISSILKAHWKIGLATFIMVCAAAVAFAFLTPKSYSATATMMLNFRSVDPLAAKEFDEGSHYSFLSTQMELMQSDEVLDRVIEALNLKSAREFAIGNAGGDATLRDWVEAKLRDALSITPGRAGSQLIYVTASSSSAQLSADIANAVVKAFLEKRGGSDANPSTERVNRYSEELETLKQKVESAQAAFSNFRNQAGSVDMDSNESDLLDTLEHRLLDAKNALRSSQARNSARQELTTSQLTSSSISNLREEANRLAAKMADLRTVDGPNHPDVLALQSQIDANKASIHAAQLALASANSSDISVTNSEVVALQQAVNAQRAKVIKNKTLRDEAAKYQLELDSAQSVYKRALEGYDQQKFAANGPPSDISVATPARPPVTATKPKRLKLVAMGVMAGGLLGLIVPFLIELPRRKIRNIDDLENGLKIEVLTSLPKFSKFHSSSAGSI